MAASIQNDAGFVNFEKAAPVGCTPIIIDTTIPATGLESALDRVNLCTVAAGRTIVCIDIISNGDGDANGSPTLDMDLVISENADPSQAGTETIIYDGGTRFQASNSTVARVLVNHKAVDTTDGNCVIRTKVNTGAATAAAMTFQAIIWIM